MIVNLVRRLPRPLRAPLRAAGIHTGRHRGPRAVDPVPIDTEAGEFRYCPEELRTTYHAIQDNGSTRCWTCNTESEASTA